MQIIELINSSDPVTMSFLKKTKHLLNTKRDKKKDSTINLRI